MQTIHRLRQPLIVAIALFILVFLLVLGTRFVLANKDVPLFSLIEIPDSPTGWGDDVIYEVGVEWVNDFPGTQYDLHYKDDICNGLINHLSSSGWIPRFNFGNAAANASDFDGWFYDGREDTYPDSVDLAMICSRSAKVFDYDRQYYTTAIAFNELEDFQYFSPGEAENQYGDQDLEWLALDASGVLTDTYVAKWAAIMKGLHLILGFKTSEYNSAALEGEVWAMSMRGAGSCLVPKTITQSWFFTVDYVQPADTCARVVAERDDNFGDYLWGEGYVSSDTPYDYNYSSLDHCSTGPASKELLSSYNQPEVLAMPIIQVVDRVVNEDYVMNNIAPAFNLMNQNPCHEDNKYVVSQFSGGITLTLEVDDVTGAFSFHNLNSLWTVPVITPTLPSEGIAAGLIDNWFRTTPAMNLPGAGYRNAGYEYMTEDFISNIPKFGSNQSLQGQQASILPANVAMTYPRILTVASQTSDGIQQVNYPVLGPGGRMKIYLGDAGEIIGAQGGSRDVHVMGDMVNVLDPSVVWNTFLANPQLAIGEIDITGDTITHTVPTLGYYEMPYSVHQDELIPVYEFRAYFYSAGDLVAGNVPVYLPAAQYYMPPQVSILNPPSGSTFWSGEPITFNGSISGGTPPYTIEWVSSRDGYLGNTLNIVANLTTPYKDGSIFTQTVSFNVTDANGLTSTATVSLKIKPLFWLPAIYK